SDAYVFIGAERQCSIAGTLLYLLSPGACAVAVVAASVSITPSEMRQSALPITRFCTSLR
ncbi:MAG: hypothetical protein RR900_06535, partial [Ruthenibacterium sp.]